MYTKSYTTLLIEIKQQLNKQKNILCSWIRRLKIYMIAVLTILFYRFNAFPIKIPTDIFAEMDKMVLKFVQRLRNSEKPNNFEKKKEQNWRIHNS